MAGASKAGGFRARSFGFSLSSVLCFSLIACSKLQQGDVVQFQSPDPTGRGGTQPIAIKNVTKDIRVRLFPILSAPPGEPYPITKNIYEVEIKNSSGIKIFDGEKLVGTAHSVHVLSKVQKIRLDDDISRDLPLKMYRLIPVDTKAPSLVSWDLQSGAGSIVQLPFRGEFEVRPVFYEEFSGNLWSLINVVDVEDYLQAVVPSEVPTYWHPTTLAVQAIAARSYAIRQMVIARGANRIWDVDPTTMYQSYRGVDKERDSTTNAVEVTAGIVMTYDDGIIEASFSSHSGGITCSAKECFGRAEDAQYLQPKSDAIEIETRSTPVVGTWQACTTPELIQYHLARYGYKGAKAPQFSAPVLNGKTPLEVCRDPAFRNRVKRELAQDIQVKNIIPMSNSSTGRAWNLDFNLSSESVRLNPSETKFNGKPYLPSMRTVFLGRRSHLMRTIKIENDGLMIVQGHGFGHGVGMSQYGSQLRADKYKHTVSQILEFYYTGIDLKRLVLH